MIIPILFYLLSALAVFSALMVVISHHPVRSVLFLVLTFFAAAGIWLILEAEFLALILLLVYVGAVMTLFLFVVMMLNVDLASERKGFVRYLPFAILIAFLIVLFTLMIVNSHEFGSQTLASLPEKGADYSNIEDLGAVLYTDYAYPFEIAAVLLLTAIIAAIGLTHRRPKGRKQQKVSDQIAVQPGDRVRLVKFKRDNS